MFAGVMADVSKVTLPANNGPYREGKGMLFEGGTRVCGFANWPGHVNAKRRRAHPCGRPLPDHREAGGASTEKCKPLDGVDVWSTISTGSNSPRTEIVYNIEPFRAAMRQGDWKVIWRTMLPSSVELYNIAADPSESKNLAARPSRAGCQAQEPPR